MHFDVLFRAGMPPIITVAEPGAHGAVTGTHGIGVNTPSAAAVAEATVGLAIDMHMPKVGMFVIGMLSMIVAAGAPAIVLLVGITISAEGATPNVQVIAAPAVTSCGIRLEGVEVKLWPAVSYSGAPAEWYNCMSWYC